jgi:hypothetical protein
MVSFVPLDPTNDETVESLLLQIDHAIQFGEDADVKVHNFGEDTNDEGFGFERENLDE